MHLKMHTHAQAHAQRMHTQTHSTDEMIRSLGGTPKKSSMNTIPFSPEMRALAYVMIHNLYPVQPHYTVSSENKISV